MPVMPMFPLGTVLLPAMPLSLRIFEERYLKLLGDLVTSDKPEFGVVLIERGPEVGGEDKRMNIGTVASVTNIGTLDEFYGLESVGAQRFRVNAWLPDDPYPLADIDFIPDLIWDASLTPAKTHLEEQVRKLLSFASEFGDLQYGPDTEFSDDPIDACWQMAGVLPIGQLDQRDLLGSVSAEELISQTLDIVKTADRTLLQMMQPAPDEDDPTD
ncbi:MAG: LON peptidase substrate-binding domain-containing protein [Rhodoluna sp.]|nr:LON peptidase substrate-binding domain-containing protein [Rhodoluna sp.]